MGETVAMRTIIPVIWHVHKARTSCMTGSDREEDLTSSALRPGKTPTRLPILGVFPPMLRRQVDGAVALALPEGVDRANPP
jgi:hypothetical protein